MAKLVLVKSDGTEQVVRNDLDENISPFDVLIRSDFIATKLWCDEDIRGVLEEEGYEGSDEEVEAVINNGWCYLKHLDDCTDTDWDIIRDAVRAVLGQEAKK